MTVLTYSFRSLRVEFHSPDGVRVFNSHIGVHVLFSHVTDGVSSPFW